MTGQELEVRFVNLCWEVWKLSVLGVRDVKFLLQKAKYFPLVHVVKALGKTN